MNDLNLWVLFFLCGLATYLIRLSFIQLHGKSGPLLRRSQPVLLLLPPAILAALCIPPIVYSKQAEGLQVELAQILAGCVAVVLAKYFKSLLWPILGGMIFLWGYRWLIG
ncbi:AzlD domain-containing protein [Neptunomonas antarctica]|uniref:Branched-chain amino acid transport protein n=1 Tax=Neptunomonas antarctica TaxID=619304 RepID=A0A1N7MVP9_9GAMM|nr:AzlD domain-containing protein [Neptunomonas antarctica]SIS90224.1 Branched-chain amino acid transport protein [Neptunomonas antarctica]